MNTRARWLPLLAPLLGACGNSGMSLERLDSLPRALSIQEQEVISASNDFAFRLLRQVAEEDGGGMNLFISPLSISMALGMAANGTAGPTFFSIKATLGLEHQSRQEFNEGYRDLLDLLRTLDPRVELNVANSAWARLGFPIRPTFLDDVSTYFGAQAAELDFDDPGAKDVINAWVSEQTNGRIDEIVQAIKHTDILFLINAVYFLGDWRTQFDPGETRQGAFQLDEGAGSVEVPMMSEEDMPLRIHYDAVRGVQVGELPYGADAFSMVIVVPSQGGLEGLVGSLTQDDWSRWMDGLRVDTMPVVMPKYELEYEIELSDVLKALGMEIAFDPDRADFSPLTEVGGIYIDRVKHKTFLKVDEEGTEAAAATSVAVGVTSLPPTFVVDRPFLLAIRERLTGTILFLGAVYDPS